ncbi:MAG: DUF3276 family protein [Bacteroidota bacterium]
MQGRDEVYSKRIRAGKRTYFFDVRSTRSSDYYITITESKKRFNNRGYDKHKIFLYKEDFNKFQASLVETIDYVKTELLPDYDYEEFDRREEEYQRQREAEMNVSFDEGEEVTAEAETDSDPADTDIEVETESLSTRWEE